jgi:hypothetical protein
MEPKEKLISMDEFKKPGPLNPTKELQKMLDALEMMRTFAIIRGSLHKEIAMEKRSQFDAYVKEGFTPEQALVLIK